MVIKEQNIVYLREIFRRTKNLALSVVKKSDSGCKVVDDDADVIQSLDRHVPTIAAAES